MLRRSIKVFLVLLLSFSSQVSAEFLLFELGTNSHPTTNEAPLTSRGGYDLFVTPPDSSPRNTFIYALDSVDGVLDVFSDSSDGKLTYATSISSAAILTGANAMAFSPDGRFLVVVRDAATHGGNALHVFYRGAAGATGTDPAPGAETADFLNTTTATRTTSLYTAYNLQDAVFSGDGNSLHVVGTNGTNGVVITLQSTGFDYADPGVTYSEVQELVDGTDINDLENPVALSLPVNVVSSSALYLVSDGDDALFSDDSVAHFSRNQTTGSLTLQTVSKHQGNSTLDGLENPTDIVSYDGDGNDVYISAANSDSLIYLKHIVDNGSLNPRVSLKDDVNSVDGLDGVSKLLLSDTGQLLYTAATVENKIGIFSIESGVPVPVLESTHPAVEGGASSEGGAITGIDAVSALILSGSNEYLFASGLAAANTGVARFSRTSSLSVNVEKLDARAEPGQIVDFRVTLTNNGPADAPRPVMGLTPSHKIISVAGQDGGAASTCPDPFTFCDPAVLNKGDSISITFSMNPLAITTAMLTAKAASRNALPGTDLEVSDTDSIVIGDFRNGSLSMSPALYFLFFLLFWGLKGTRGS